MFSVALTFYTSQIYVVVVGAHFYEPAHAVGVEHRHAGDIHILRDIGYGMSHGRPCGEHLTFVDPFVVMVDFTGEYHPVFLNIRCDSAVIVYTDGVSVFVGRDGDEGFSATGVFDH